jgi:transcriptional regulator with XRE-family HTH domain
MEASQSLAIRNKIIGVLVKRARTEAGMTQKECAQFLGCTPSAFRRYEQGKKGFSLPQLESLALLFDVPVASLWDDAYPLPDKTEEEPLPLDQIMLLRRKMLAVRLRQVREAAGLSMREMGKALDCSPYMVSQYEQGAREVPLAELEMAAERCGQTIAEFLDDEAIPLSPAEQRRRILERLEALPPDMRDFVLNPTNVLYLRIAMLASALKADELRKIAETLLDITY